MRAAIVGALVCFVATGAALAKQEQLKPERPTIEAQREEPALRRKCEPFVIEWWVQAADGSIKLAGRQTVLRCD
jgi:hypothetical protein